MPEHFNAETHPPDDADLGRAEMPILDDPAKQAAARLIARNCTVHRAADEVKRSPRQVYRWLAEDHLFRAAVEFERSEWAAEIMDAERSDADDLRSTVRAALVGLKGQDLSMFLARVAEKPTETTRALACIVGASDKVHLIRRRAGRISSDPSTVINVSASASALASVTAQSVAIPCSASLDDFVVRDMGIDLAEIYPRVLWLLRQIDRDCVRLVLMKTGKGAGKGRVIQIALARQVQRMEAMVAPSREVGLASDEKLGIANLSGSGQMQAQLAVFSGMKRDLERSPWFRQHAPVDAAKEVIDLPKNLVCVSGNSSSKEFEGVCLVAAGADEVCRMELADDQHGEHQHVKSLVEPVLATMISRVPRHYKMLLASWPEHAADWLTKEIARRVEVEGVVEDMTAAFLASPLTRGTDSDEDARRSAVAIAPFRDFPVRVLLTGGGTLVVESPTWQMKPDADLDALSREERLNPVQFARMFGASPKRSGSNPYVADVDAVRRGANPAREHPWDDAALHAVMAVAWDDTDVGKAEMRKAILSCVVDPVVRKAVADGKPVEGSGAALRWGRIDLGVKKDSCGIAVAHYDGGRIVYDFMLELRPEPGQPVRIKFTRAILVAWRSLGYDFGGIEFDQFEGQSNVQEFQDDGFDAEIKSVDRSRRPYDVWRSWLLDGKLDYSAYEPFFRCCADLIDLGRKIEHLPGGAKDITDAACGIVGTILEKELGVKGEA